MSSERERSGERAKYAAHNPLHHKIIPSKNLKIDFKSYHETDSVNSLKLYCVENKNDFLTKEHHFNAALWPGYRVLIVLVLGIVIPNLAHTRAECFNFLHSPIIGL